MATTGGWTWQPADAPLAGDPSGAFSQLPQASWVLPILSPPSRIRMCMQGLRLNKINHFYCFIKGFLKCKWLCSRCKWVAMKNTETVHTRSLWCHCPDSGQTCQDFSPALAFALSVHMSTGRKKHMRSQCCYKNSVDLINPLK